jgi:hypothetical protein
MALKVKEKYGTTKNCGMTEIYGDFLSTDILLSENDARRR